jgi:hypothetical protein
MAYTKWSPATWPCGQFWRSNLKRKCLISFALQPAAHLLAYTHVHSCDSNLLLYCGEGEHSNKQQFRCNSEIKRESERERERTTPNQQVRSISERESNQWKTVLKNVVLSLSFSIRRRRPYCFAQQRPQLLYSGCKTGSLQLAGLTKSSFYFLFCYLSSIKKSIWPNMIKEIFQQISHVFIRLPAGSSIFELAAAECKKANRNSIIQRCWEK